MASLTYCAIAHISGVEELSGWPKVNPPVPGRPVPDLLGDLVPALAAPAIVASMDWAPVRFAVGDVVFAAFAGQHRPRVADAPTPV